MHFLETLSYGVNFSFQSYAWSLRLHILSIISPFTKYVQTYNIDELAYVVKRRFRQRVRKNAYLMHTWSLTYVSSAFNPTTKQTTGMCCPHAYFILLTFARKRSKNIFNCKIILFANNIKF